MEIQLVKLQKYLDARDYKKAKAELLKISNKNLALIVLHADASANSLIEHLKSPELEPFWAEKYHNLRVYQLPDFKFFDIPGRSYRDLYCGYVLFLQALKSKDHSLYYLNLAMKGFNSFHALQEYSSILMENIGQGLQTVDYKDPALDETIAQSLLRFYFVFAAQLGSHKTPGFLCLANITVFLARFYHCANNAVLSKLFFENSWYHLHLATLLEKQSLAEINNAYFGKGLALSNHLYLDSIIQLKQACFMAAKEANPDFLDLTQQERLEKLAASKALEEFPELLHEEEQIVSPPVPSPKQKRTPSVLLQAFLLLSPIYKASSTAKSACTTIEKAPCL